MQEPNFELIRQNYPVLRRCAWLDASTSGLIAQNAHDAMAAKIKQRFENGMIIPEYDAEFDYARETGAEIAKMIGAKGTDEICFGTNESTLFNIFSNGLHLKAGDNVITYDSAYISIPYAWVNLADRLGIEVRFATAKEGVVAPEQLFALVDENTKAISLPHVDNRTGYRHDLKTIGEFCHRRGIAFGVDATQSCGALQIDVQDAKIDFLCAASYKWLCSELGLGFAYIKKEFMDTLQQDVMGWRNTVDCLGPNDSRVIKLSPTATRFENGGLPFAQMHMLSASVGNYLRLGAEPIEKRILSHVNYLYDAIEEIPNVSLYFAFPEENRSGIVVLRVPEEWGLTVQKLSENGIGACMHAPDRMRLGIHYYNNRADIDRLLAYLKSFSK